MRGLMDYCEAAVELSSMALAAIWQLLPQYGLAVFFAAVRMLYLEILFFFYG